MSKTNQKHQKRMEYISSFIRNYRLNNGMTQNDLSEFTNSFHINTLKNLETGKRKNISLLKLFQILDALDLSPQDLFMDVD